MSEPSSSPRSRLGDFLSRDVARKLARRWAWGLPPVLGAFLVMNQGLSTSRLFFDRDLSFFYWPEHLWLRASLFSGEIPLWDPYVGFGQSAIADPVRQILFLPTLPIRLLFPPEIGFNLLVLLPIVLAGLGAFVFFRRCLSPVGASLAASVFALAGPVVSTANSLNFSWSMAFLPWILWAADRLARSPSPRGVVLWSILQGLQILAGEPVTAALTALVAVAYVALVRREVPPAQSLGWSGLAVVLGGFLVAVQLLPLLEAAQVSSRAQQGLGELLALHPLSLAELVGWPLFGERFPPAGQPNLWLRALNGGTLPLFTSMYIGPGALVLAAFGAWLARRDRWCRFWLALGLVALVLALGQNTPVYSALRTLVPPLGALRYPAKYFLPVTVAIAALAGFGWDWMVAQTRVSPRRAVPAAFLALVALSGIGLVHVFPVASSRIAEAVATSVRLANPGAAATTLVEGAGSAALRLAILAAALAVLTAIGASPSRRLLLFTLCVMDPLSVNVMVNPTMSVALLGEPPWVASTREHPEGRVYVGGRISWVTGLRDIDNVPRQLDARRAQVSEEAFIAAYQTMFATFPSAWRVREPVSLDLTALWPYDYTRFVVGFAGATREERTRFLRRTGTRYFLTNAPPSESAHALLRLVGYPPVALYEEPEPHPRVAVVPQADVEPEFDPQFVRLFSKDFDTTAKLSLYEEPPAPAGEARPPQQPGAVILQESANEMEIQTHVGVEGGYLLVWDSFSPGWLAWVDGAEARLLRANGFFRALRLSPGDHRVRLAYRPRSLVVGAVVSLVTAVVLLALVGLSYRKGWPHRT